LNITDIYQIVIIARMAELVDALVSNTSGSNAVPVRSRLRVHSCVGSLPD
jgi:hypothetical protein